MLKPPAPSRIVYGVALMLGFTACSGGSGNVPKSPTSSTPTSAPSSTPTLVPSATPTPTPVPSSMPTPVPADCVATPTLDGVTGCASIMAQPSSVPVSLATNADGSMLSDAEIASDLAPPPPAAGNAGAIGTIVSIAKGAFTMRQQGLFPQADANGSPFDFVQNNSSLGSATGTVAVTMAPGAIVASQHGFADLAVGSIVMAGGTASANALAAKIVVPLSGAAQASSSHRAVATSFEKLARRAYSAPAGWTVVPDAFASAAPGSGAQKLPIGAAVTTVPGIPCVAFDTGKLQRSGTVTILSSFDFALNFGLLTVNMPFDVDYNPLPSPYVQTGANSWNGPGAMPSWLNFEALAGSANEPTLQRGSRAYLAVRVSLTTSCAEGTFDMNSSVLGKGLEATATAPMPGPNRSVVMKATQCLNAGFLSGPASTIANLALNVQACDVPRLEGTAVNASVPTSVTQGVFSGTFLSFDPTADGSASVTSAPVLSPTGPTASFQIGTWSYKPTFTDAYTLGLTIFGRCIVGIPTCGSNPDAGGEAIGPSITENLSATPVTVTLNAPRTPTCLETAPQKTNACYVSLEDPKASGFVALSNIGKLTVSEPGYSGSFTWNPDAPGHSASAPTYDRPSCSNSYFSSAFTIASESGGAFTITQTKNLYGPEPMGGIILGYDVGCYGVFTASDGTSAVAEIVLEGELKEGQTQP